MRRKRQSVRCTSTTRRSSPQSWAWYVTNFVLPVLVLGVAAWIFLPSWSEVTSGFQSGGQVRELRVEVHRRFPHDRTAYTQGLILFEGKLLESTGRYGQSDVRRLDPLTGNVEQRVGISPAFFGEGIARIEDRLIMLTYKAQRAFALGIEQFDQLETFRYRGEGWGLCNDGRRLIMSNGSSRLTFRDLQSFEEIGGVDVTLRGVPQMQLNELECVDGTVYANVYQRDIILRIDLTSGYVTEYIDASGLLTPEESRGVDVLNGIAYDPGRDRFYITGKLWPTMFEVTFEE
ncbi:MAG: glutaminyl-peptide cyclotransferase [Acidobacteriota bacterium]|nr:glutaminyl-peptide cyclotransferase [Acidobacteriota bacterium]